MLVHEWYVTSLDFDLLPQAVGVRSWSTPKYLQTNVAKHPSLLRGCISTNASL